MEPWDFSQYKIEILVRMKELHDELRKSGYPEDKNKEIALNAEINKRKGALKFICPKCGSHRLQSIELSILVVEINTIYDSGDIDYGDNKIGNGALDGIDHYACGKCDFIVDYGHIDTPDNLVEWIKKNC